MICSSARMWDTDRQYRAYEDENVTGKPNMVQRQKLMLDYVIPSVVCLWGA